MDLKNCITDTQAGWNLFDSLEPVTAAELTGVWNGYELRTGHPMEGLLTVAPWYGKQFLSAEEVHPLLFSDRDGTQYAVSARKAFGMIGNPVLLKLATVFAAVVNRRGNFDSHRLDGLFHLLRTKKSGARIREIQYRGAVTAAMVYDELAIIDVFRRVDENTLLGVMDIKGRLGQKGYFFVLERPDAGGVNNSD